MNPLPFCCKLRKVKCFFLKVWWQDATLFVYFSYIHAYIHSFNHIHTVHLSIAIRWGLSPFPHRSSAQWGNTSLRCRGENRTRACLTASRRCLYKDISFTQYSWLKMHKICTFRLLVPPPHSSLQGRKCLLFIPYRGPEILSWNF